MPPESARAPDSGNERWLGEKRVSHITGISLSTLRKQRFASVGIPYYKLGRSVRSKLSDVITYMESKRIIARRLAHS